MKFIKVPALFAKTTEYDSYEKMGLVEKVPTFQQDMYVNTQHIISFSKDGEDGISMVLPDGDYKIMIDYNDFLKLIEDEITD